MAGARDLPLAVARFPRSRRPLLDLHTLGLLVTLGATSLWTAAVVIPLLGRSARLAVYFDLVLPLGPALALLAVMLSRPHSPLYLKLALGWMASVFAAYESVALVDTRLDVALAPIALAGATLFALRKPAAAIAMPVLLGGFFGTISAYLTSPAPLADVFLAGAWFALAWSFLTGKRQFPKAFPGALVVTGVYLLASLVYALVGDPLYPNLYGFRWGPWYLTAVFLTAYFLHDADTRERATRLLILIAAAVMGYAVLRWIIGPSGKEEELIRQGGRYVLDAAGDLRSFGSLPGPTALGFWSAAVCPFAMAVALCDGPRRWRLVALFAALTAGANVFGADTRVSIIGCAAGVMIVFALFAIGRSFTGHRVLPLVAAGTLALAMGTAFVAARLDPDDPGNVRFRGLLAPSQDYSFQARTEKWKEVLADIHDHPFGHGMDASGVARRFERFVTIAQFDPDSTYVKITYDQGILVVIIYIAGLLIIFAELCRRALTTANQRAAMLAMGGAGSLAAYGIAMSAGIFNEGPTALAAWVIVGLALSPYVNAQSRAPASRRSAQ